MKYFLSLNQDNRVTGVYSEDYLPDGLTLVEIDETTAKLPNTTQILEDWLFYNNTLTYDPVEVPVIKPVFIQIGI